MPRINVTTDPLTFWRANEMELPKFANLARRFLCPPASSSTSEREFKVAKLLVEKRIKLLPSNVEKLLFLKYNLRSLEYSTQLPSPPEDFQLPNRKSYEMTVDNNGNVDNDDDNLYDSDEDIED